MYVLKLMKRTVFISQGDLRLKCLVPFKVVVRLRYTEGCKLGQAAQMFHLFIYLFIYLFIHSFIYLFMAALGLRCCVQAFSSCGKRGLLFVAVHGLLIAMAA